MSTSCVGVFHLCPKWPTAPESETLVAMKKMPCFEQDINGVFCVSLACLFKKYTQDMISVTKSHKKI